ncbi:hypothetical protein F2Q69_00029815 [Brassica cretica]|uniref:Uncharacterized protein n=1 Tax=Brassica cretica TaxID=69181 RepID=A0A8S9S962_BRACR|nr:hypothetical protein F2Q69_00029815 [Brassica cretica]
MSGSMDFGVASHTSLSDSPVAHPSLFPFSEGVQQNRLWLSTSLPILNIQNQTASSESCQRQVNATKARALRLKNRGVKKKTKPTIPTASTSANPRGRKLEATELYISSLCHKDRNVVLLYMHGGCYTRNSKLTKNVQHLLSTRASEATS